jgi:hypothetical protein
MVDKVIAACAREGRKATAISISDHGNVAGFRVGTDWIDIKTLPRYVAEFARLATMFDTPGWLFIEACEAGQAEPLLMRLSSLLGGVTVVGRRELQGIWGPTGLSTMCQPRICMPILAFTLD